MTDLRLSVFLPQGLSGELDGYPGPAAAYDALAAVARAVDDHPFSTVWLADHLQTFVPGRHVLFEGWTTAAALARETSRVRIGHLVTCTGFRNPGLQAAMAVTLDAISGGRYTFGIGAGYDESEHRAFGYDLPSPAERMDRLEEAVQVILALWSEGEASFSGRHHRVDGATVPPSVQRPHVPLLIGGGGERRTLQLVARYADACNVSADPAGLVHKFEVLRKHCADAGRDYDSISRTVLTHCILADSDAEGRRRVPPWASAIYPGDIADYGLIGTAATIRQRLAAYAAAGAQELVIGFDEPLDPDTYRRFADELLG